MQRRVTIDADTGEVIEDNNMIQTLTNGQLYKEIPDYPRNIITELHHITDLPALPSQARLYSDLRSVRSVDGLPAIGGAPSTTEKISDFATSEPHIPGWALKPREYELILELLRANLCKASSGTLYFVLTVTFCPPHPVM